MTAEKFLERASGLRIAIIGDLINDVYIHGEVHRISPEAPVPILLETHRTQSLGGAGNVWMNLMNLGVNADLYCNSEIDVRENLPATNDSKIFINDYPCATKYRMMAGNHQLLRVDVETPVTQIEWLQFNQFSWWRELTERIGTYDAIVIVDYGKGVVSDGVINTLIDLAKINDEPIPIIVDAKKDFHRFAGISYLKCNKNEAGIINRQQFIQENRIAAWIVTHGEQGITFSTNPQFAQGGDVFGIDGLPTNIVDVCGAGDTVTAVLSIGLGLKMSIDQTCFNANVAASEVVRHPFVHSITADEFVERYNEVIGPS